MSMFSGIISRPINWDKADAEQKLAALAKLASNDPLLGQLAIQEADERVRHAAIRHMDAETQLQLLEAIDAKDVDCLAACLAEHLGGTALPADELQARLMGAPASLRIALVSHAKNEALSMALTKSLALDTDRALVARGKGLIDARAAAVDDMRELELLDAIAHEYRDKQRRIYRAAHDRTAQLLAAREVVRRAQELCGRLTGLLERHELTLTAFTTAEREWAALAASPSSPLPAEASDTQYRDDFPALQARYAALKDQARTLLQQQAESWRDADRLKAAITDLVSRSDADEAVDPDAFAALLTEREAAAERLAHAEFTALPKERAHLVESLGKLSERHAILATESKALANARRLAEELRHDPATLTPTWRAEFARSIAIVRPALRAPIEEAAAAVRNTIEAAERQKNEAQRAVEQQYRMEIDALVRQMEQLLDKGQHQQANEVATVLKDKIASGRPAEGAAARNLPTALEFRMKRCHDRLAKMNEWKRFGDIKAREALCREAEALVKRVTRQEKTPAAKEKPADFPWPVGPQAVPESAPQDSAPPTAEADEALHAPVPVESAETPITSEALVDAPALVAETSVPQAEASAESTAPADSTAQATPAAEGPARTASDVAAVTTPALEADEPPLAPDALAAAVRDLQARWQQLDKAHGASSKGLWERFRRACDRAYAPARKHFEELEKQRAQNVEKKNAVLDKLAALGERIVDGADWGKILNERGELVKAWFDAGALPRRNAAALQKRFDALTTAVDKQLGARRAGERARRRNLIDQAKVIAEKAADGASMAAMITLQKQWQEGMKGAIRLKAREDQSLWEEFRAAGSALFGKRDAEKAARAGERDAQVAERRALIEEFQALAAGDDAGVIRRGIDELSARWQSMTWPDRKPLREWEQKFSGARAAATARIAAIRDEADSRQRAIAAARLAVVDRAEQALASGGTPDIDAVRAEVQATLAEGEKPDARVMTRLAALDAAIKIGPDAWRAHAQKTQGERDALLLELEIVLGLPSPPALEAERRMRMLKRLAESKNARSTPPLMAADAPRAVEKLLALPMAMQGVQARVEAVVEAARRKPK